MGYTYRDDDDDDADENAGVDSGNDLARVLRWGPGYNGEDEPLSLLRDVIDAEEIKLDRSVRLCNLFLCHLSCTLQLQCIFFICGLLRGFFTVINPP